MDELYWEALSYLQGPSERALGAIAEQLSAASHQLFGEADRAQFAAPESRPDAASVKWLGWYAGQLRCIVALLQARRSQTERKPSPLIRRKYTIAALEALRRGELNLSQLAAHAGISDPSQASRVVDGLAKEGLVSDSKEGTHRLIRLTAAGLRALPAELQSSDGARLEPQAPVASDESWSDVEKASSGPVSERRGGDAGAHHAQFRSIGYGGNPPSDDAWSPHAKHAV